MSLHGRPRGDTEIVHTYPLHLCPRARAGQGHRDSVRNGLAKWVFKAKFGYQPEFQARRGFRSDVLRLKHLSPICIFRPLGRPRGPLPAEELIWWKFRSGFARYGIGLTLRQAKRSGKVSGLLAIRRVAAF
jgi:hypothetical protein